MYIEFRDDSWFDDDVVALLDSHQIACCLYDLEGEQSPDYLTTDFAYIRLHGPGARYQGCYSQKLLKPWVQRIHAWLDNKIRVYCYFNNDFGGYAPKNALSLKEMLQSVIN